MEKSKNTQKSRVWIRQTLTNRSKFPYFSPDVIIMAFLNSTYIRKWGQKALKFFDFAINYQ